MKSKTLFLTLLLSALNFVGCAPKLADLEQEFRDKITSAHRAKDFEQLKSLHSFQDETPKMIEMLLTRWDSVFKKEIDSIDFEVITEDIKERIDVGYQIDGKWYEIVPSPYKMVRIHFKKDEKTIGHGSHWSEGMGKLVAIEGNQIVFPGMKLMELGPKPIKIVLPESFTGKFSLVWIESGITPNEEEKSITYIIPEGGKLEVSSLGFLMQDRPMIIEYNTGAVIYEDGKDKSESDGVYFDPQSQSMVAGNIGAPMGVSGSNYFGTKITWEIKKNESANKSQ